MRLPRWLAATLGVIVIIIAGLYWLARPLPVLTVVSWGDVYGRAQTIALFHPFADKAHVDVNVANYGGGLKEIAAQVASGDVAWDVVDMELEDAAKACREGLLERLNDLELPPGANGQAARRDFVPGALGPCWVGSAVYSQVIAFDSQPFWRRAAAHAGRFFRPAAAIPARADSGKGPKYNLELALIADGVQPWRVYSVLSTPEGVDRALRKLDTIKKSILWWRRIVEPAQMLNAGRIAMSTALNARVFDLNANPKIRTIWDGQLYQLDVFGIPKGIAEQEARGRFHPLCDWDLRLWPTRRAICPMVRRGFPRSRWSSQTRDPGRYAALSANRTR